MTPNETTAMNLYHDQCDIWNATTAPTWGELPEHRKVLWRQLRVVSRRHQLRVLPPRRTLGELDVVVHIHPQEGAAA